MSQDLLKQAREILDDDDRGAKEFKKFLQDQSKAGNADFLTDSALKSLVEGREDGLLDEVEKHAQAARDRVEEASEEKAQEEDNKLEQSQQEEVIQGKIVTGPEADEYSKEFGNIHDIAEDKRLLGIKAISNDKGEEIELELDKDGVNLEPLTEKKFTGIVKIPRRNEQGEFDTEGGAHDILEYDKGVIKNGLIQGSPTPSLIKEQDRLALANVLKDKYVGREEELSSQLGVNIDKIEVKTPEQQKEEPLQEHEAARDDILAGLVERESHKRNVREAASSNLSEDERQDKIQKTDSPPELEQEQMASLATHREPIEQEPEEPAYEPEQPKQEQEQHPVEAALEQQIQKEHVTEEIHEAEVEKAEEQQEKDRQQLRGHLQKERAEEQGVSMGDGPKEFEEHEKMQARLRGEEPQELASPEIGDPLQEYPPKVVERAQGMQEGMAKTGLQPGLDKKSGGKSVATNLQAQAEQIGTKATMKQPPKAKPQKPDTGPAIAAGSGGRM